MAPPVFLCLLLAEAEPKYAAISVRAGNSYGHPTAQALQRLQAVKAKIYRTDQMGTIQMQVQNGGIQATTQKAVLPCASIGRQRKLQKSRRQPLTEMGARKPARSVRLAVTQRSLPLQRLLRCQRPSWQRRFILITARCKNRR